MQNTDNNTDNNNTDNNTTDNNTTDNNTREVRYLPGDPRPVLWDGTRVRDVLVVSGD